MAELTAEEKLAAAQEELAAAKKELKQKDEVLAAKELALAEKETALSKAADSGVVALPVAGSYTAKWKDDATGKSKTKKVAFKDGRVNVRLKDGQLVTSEGVLKIANGEAPSPLHVKKHPVLKTVSQEAAEALLTHYAKIGAGFLK